MLSSTVRPTLGTLRCLRILWGRVLTIFVLLFATPGAVPGLEELVSIAVGVEDCADPCDDGNAESCPGTCGHCVCCAHPNGLAAPAPLQLAVQVSRALSFGGHADRPHSSGYRARPFRPPSV